MNKPGIKRLLKKALKEKELVVEDSMIDEFIDLNYESEGVLLEWEQEDFDDLAARMKLLSKSTPDFFWDAIRLYDFVIPEE